MDIQPFQSVKKCQMAYSDGQTAIPIRNTAPNVFPKRIFSLSATKDGTKCPTRKDVHVYSIAIRTTDYDFINKPIFLVSGILAFQLLFASDFFPQYMLRAGLFLPVHSKGLKTCPKCTGKNQISKNVLINVSQIKLMLKFPVGCDHQIVKMVSS
jgi:hypothetical protein